MSALQATVQKAKVLDFQSRQSYYPYEHYQTSSERQIYSKMYQQTNNGRESKRFTLDALCFTTGIKSQDTVRVALAGLVRKKHVTILDKKGCRHHGILYRIQMPHEIRALNQDPEYLAEQERLAEEIKIQKAKAKQPKPKQEKLQFDEPPPGLSDPPDQPTDEEPQTPPALSVMPATTAPPGAAVEPLAEAANLPEIPAIRVTESTDLDESENPKIRVTETQKLGSQKARILFMYLTWVLTHENTGGGLGIPMRACMCEAQPSETETPSVAAPPVVPPVISRQKQSATVSPESTALGQALMVMLNWTDIVLDQRLKAELRRGYAWFTANHATPEEILRFKVWWWESDRIKPPKLDWMIENFPVFRGDLAAPQATGTAAKTAPASPIKFPTKASYHALAAQMSQAYTGKHWESISEKMAVFKGYVLRAGIAWNDDLANEIFA